MNRSLGPPGRCQPFVAVVTRKLDLGLPAQRIYQDLVVEHGFDGSYSSVGRFIRRLGQRTPWPFRRIECEPGEEAQVDFGRGAWIVQDGHRQASECRCLASDETGQQFFEAAFREYGLLLAIRTSNGPAFAISTVGAAGRRFGG